MGKKAPKVVKSDTELRNVDKFHSIFNFIDEGFCIYEVIYDESEKPFDLRWEEVNPAYEKQTGLKDVVGKRHSELSMNTEQYWLDIYDKVVRTGEAANFENWHQPTNRWYRVFASRIDGPESKQVAVVFEDITERKQQEQQQAFLLKLSDALRTEPSPEAITKHALQMLFDHLKLDCCYVGIFHLEEDYGEFPYHVQTDKFPPLPRGVRLSDFPEALLKSFTSTLVMDDILKDENLSDIDKQNFTAMGYRGLAVATVRKGENNPLWSIVAVTAKPWHWTPGEIRLLEEATERTWAAVERAKAEETLKKLNESLTIKKKEAEVAFKKEKLINEELRRINQVMDTFIYSAAHDLKAPVSNLKLLTEVIATTNDKELKLQLLDQYPTAIKTLDQVISGLVRVLAIEKNPGPIKDLQFQAVFNKVSKEFASVINEANSQFHTDFSSCTSIIYIESYLFSIFRNMLSNALKYRSEERKLTIDIQSRYEGKYAVLTFSDNGTGIDLKTYGKDLFKPFKRFNQQVEGSGIGLHLIKSIITKNGGKIEVESQPGIGTTFKIYLVQYNK